MAALLGLAGASVAQAGPTLRTVTVGAQSPNPADTGGLACYPVTVTRTGAGSLDAYLSAVGLPAGCTATFVPPKVSFADAGPSAKTATMVVGVAAGTPAGSYPFTVQAQKGNSQNLVTFACLLTVGGQSLVIEQRPFLNVPVVQPDGTIGLSGGGTGLQPLLVQATTNLASSVSWETIAVRTLGADGLFSLVDQDSTNYPARFYRAAQ